MPGITLPTTDGKNKQVFSENPFPTYTPGYEDINGIQNVTLNNIETLVDVLERIQQQLGLMTGVNLGHGERIT